ncbi:hypothetical protein RvY_06034-2 [Ramazzottius varieornatus]|nr:hypothetical protein RvY_06034-2 [Ramazzottius varieornatus]
MLRQACRRFSTGGRQLMAAQTGSTGTAGSTGTTGYTGTTGSTSSSSSGGGANIPAILMGAAGAAALFYAYQNFYADKYSAGPTHVPAGMKTQGGPMDTKYVKNEHDNTIADTGPNYIASNNTLGKTDGVDTRYTVDQGTS